MPTVTEIQRWRLMFERRMNTNVEFNNTELTSVTNKQKNTQNDERFDTNNNMANNNQEDENRKETPIEIQEEQNENNDHSGET
jgi:hypothetical protein